MLASSLALLIAAVGVVVPWVGHVNARNAALVQTVRERAPSADVAHLRINAGEIAALREDAAGRIKPFAGALLRRLAATVPPEVTTFPPRCAALRRRDWPCPHGPTRGQRPDHRTGCPAGERTCALAL
ncbi:MAG: hypothetical protein EXS37_16435 [Opitutus sp.]|nr:hypothetical protein [Opitutus sp.]